MKHLTIAAKATTATDRGEFVALAATYSVDRAGDRIIPGAFAKTIERWRSSGKSLPTHWNHESDPASIIGSIDPFSLRETEAGLEVVGKLDLEHSEQAREAWRAMKTGSMSLSFGYLATRQQKGSDGVNELHEIDLFEVSVVPGPANQDTRFLELKSADRTPSADIAFLHEWMKRDPAEVSREYAAKAQATVERKSHPLQVATFDVRSE